MLKFFFGFILIGASFSAFACELVMGYRTNAKPPFISAAPDNSGLYQALYKEASRRINCTLTVVRQPKARILHLMKEGAVDFYPGLSFSSARAEHFVFLPNGLKDGYIGLTRSSEPEIRSLHDVAARKLVMVVSFGGYDLNAKQYGIHTRKPYDFTLTQIVDLILEGHADFYAYNLLAVRYFLKTHPERASRLKIHNHCCQEAQQMFFGVSKRSKHILLHPNPNYRPDLTLSETNTPEQVQENSTIWRLYQALEEMAQDGSLRAIEARYFGQE